MWIRGSVKNWWYTMYGVERQWEAGVCLSLYLSPVKPFCCVSFDPIPSSLAVVTWGR